MATGKNARSLTGTAGLSAIHGIGAWFDSVGGNDKSTFVAGVYEDSAAPVEIKAIFDSIDTVDDSQDLLGNGETRGKQAKNQVLGAFYDAVESYKATHGEAPSADLIAHALKQGSTVNFDSVNDPNHSRTTGFVSAQIRVAMYSAFRDAIPFAYYMPTDPSNTSPRQPMAIVQTVANSKTGLYQAGDSVQGGYAGKVFLMSSRTLKMTDGKVKVTNTMTNDETCDPAGTALPLSRGLTSIEVAGYAAAREVSNSAGSGDNTISGTFKIGSVQYGVAGVVKFATSEVEVTFTPALPANTPVYARVVVDYEKFPDLKPKFTVQALNYEVFSEYTSAVIETTEQQSAQLERELGVNAQSAMQVAVMGQYNLERYKAVLSRAGRLAFNNNEQFAFAYNMSTSNVTRSEAWLNLKPVLAKSSQKMAKNTQDHGITHLYVDAASIGAELSSFPVADFVASGATETSTIAFVGVLWGKYRVYAVEGLNALLKMQAGKDAILAIGRSEQPSLNPFVVGDVQPPQFKSVGRTTGSAIQATLEVNSFTDANPHQPAANGCALITVTGLSQ